MVRRGVEVALAGSRPGTIVLRPPWSRRFYRVVECSFSYGALVGYGKTMNYVGTDDFTVCTCGTQESISAGCSKRPPSHPPNLGEPRRAVPQERPQQARQAEVEVKVERRFACVISALV